MRVIFLVIVLLMAVGQKPIPRNQAWNDSVQDIIVVEDGMKAMQPFLKENEYQVKIRTYNIEALEKLDKAVEASKKLTKDLEKLQEEMEKEK